MGLGSHSSQPLDGSVSTQKTAFMVDATLEWLLTNEPTQASQPPHWPQGPIAFIIVISWERLTRETCSLYRTRFREDASCHECREH